MVAAPVRLAGHITVLLVAAVCLQGCSFSGDTDFAKHLAYHKVAEKACSHQADLILQLIQDSTFDDLKELCENETQEARGLNVTSQEDLDDIMKTCMDEGDQLARQDLKDSETSVFDQCMQVLLNEMHGKEIDVDATQKNASMNWRNWKHDTQWNAEQWWEKNRDSIVNDTMNMAKSHFYKVRDDTHHFLLKSLNRLQGKGEDQGKEEVVMGEEERAEEVASGVADEDDTQSIIDVPNVIGRFSVGSSMHLRGSGGSKSPQRPSDSMRKGAALTCVGLVASVSIALMRRRRGSDESRAGLEVHMYSLVE